MAGKLGCTQIFKYTEALIKLLQWYQYRVVDFIHDIVEIELLQAFIAKNQRFFIDKKNFFLADIIRKAYKVLATAAPVQY